MGFDHLEDEEIVLIHVRIVEQATFEARMALGNKRRLDQMSLLGCQAKLAERYRNSASRAGPGFWI